MYSKEQCYACRYSASRSFRDTKATFERGNDPEGGRSGTGKPLDCDKKTLDDFPSFARRSDRKECNSRLDPILSRIIVFNGRFTSEDSEQGLRPMDGSDKGKRLCTSDYQPLFIRSTHGLVTLSRSSQRPMRLADAFQLTPGPPKWITYLRC